MILIASWLLAAATATNGDWEHAPQPREFPITSVYTAKPVEVQLEGRRSRLFRTVLRRGALKGPNFAGRYTVVTWGCGLDSFELAVVDAGTGEVYWPPFACMTLAGGFEVPHGGQTPNPAFRLDSSLLVVAGVEDGTSEDLKDRAVRFYAFEDGHFRLVYRIADVWPETPSKE
jgi:hypothetical protein